MALKKRGKVWYSRHQGWTEFGPSGFMRSTGTSNKTLATDMDYAVRREYEKGDPKGIVKAIDEKRLTIAGWFRDQETPEDEMSDGQRSLTKLYEEWMRWMPRGTNRQGRGFKPRTINRYQQSWNQLFAHLPHNPKLADLNQKFLQRYEMERGHAPRGVTGHIGRGRLSNSAWNNDMTALQSFVKWCKDRGLKVKDFKVVKRAHDKKKVRWLNAEEIGAFRDHCNNDWWVFFNLLMTTGLRFMEAVCLRPCDFKNGEVHVRMSKTATGEGRAIPMQPETGRLLMAYINREGIGSRSMIFPGWDDPQQIILTGKYNNPGYELWRNRFALVCESSGVEDATMHSLRDTFAVHCRRHGVEIANLKDLLGHGTLSMTMAYANYGPDADERKRQVAGLWGEQMAEGTAEGTKSGTPRIVNS